jgi:hypothetical protein
MVVVAEVSVAGRAVQFSGGDAVRWFFVALLSRRWFSHPSVAPGSSLVCDVFNPLQAVWSW